MTTATRKTLLTTGTIAVRLGLLEYRVRDFLRQPRAYAVSVGRMTAVAEEDLPLLIADLKSAGLLPPDATTEKHDG